MCDFAYAAKREARALGMEITQARVQGPVEKVFGGGLY